jgi:hypothetical protein
VPLTHASLPHMMTQGLITVAPKSKRRDITLRHCASRGVSSEPEAVQVLRGRAPANGCGQPTARMTPELACPETADDTPRNLTPRSKTSEPNKESWDFDGNVLTSVKNRTR